MPGEQLNLSQIRYLLHTCLKMIDKDLLVFAPPEKLT